MKDIQTRLVGRASRPEDAAFALGVPIYQAVTFRQADPDRPGEYDYSRSGNPTRRALEELMAELEGATAAFAFASGMAAISTCLLLFSAGDHLLVTRDCNGGTQRVLEHVFARLGIRADYVDTHDAAALEEARRPQTRGVLIENFSNPHLFVTDVAAVSEWAHRHGLLVLVDNTILSPVLSRPLEQGADVVLHSATKLLAGHNDVTAGVAAVGQGELARRLGFLQNAVGAVAAPHDSWLVLRGLKTLGVRLERAQTTAANLAAWLAGQDGVERVFYPGLPGHPGHERLSRVAAGAGQILSLELAPGLVRPFLASLRLFALGAGFGGVESIVSRPALSCHACLTAAQRSERSIGPGLIRVSVGLEGEADLRDDLERALTLARRENSAEAANQEVG
ncbi:MAG: PLP-dependent transferase [Thermaerobacter sp.]|nr:PLP-dependent transferase [Thermaerobacter sp.]